MIVFPDLHHEVTPRGALRMLGGGGIGVEGKKLGAFGDAIVVLVSDGIIHVIHSAHVAGEPIKLSRQS